MKSCSIYYFPQANIIKLICADFHWHIPFWSPKIYNIIQWEIPREPLAAQYNWCQGPVPGRGPAVEKHCCRECESASTNLQLAMNKKNVTIIVYIWMPSFTLLENTQLGESLSTEKTLPPPGMWYNILWYKCTQVSEVSVVFITYVEIGDSRFLWNFDTLITEYMASHTEESNLHIDRHGNVTSHTVNY